MKFKASAGWQLHDVMDTDHFFPVNSKLSWCGNEWRNSNQLLSMPRLNRGCPHCKGAILQKPLKWQKQSYYSKLSRRNG